MQGQQMGHRREVRVGILLQCITDFTNKPSLNRGNHSRGLHFGITCKAVAIFITPMLQLVDQTQLKTYPRKYLTWVALTNPPLIELGVKIVRATSGINKGRVIFMMTVPFFKHLPFQERLLTMERDFIKRVWKERRSNKESYRMLELSWKCKI